MWLTFWPDVLVAVIGASLTIVIAYGTYILNLRRNERRALNSLIMELHHRRAFSGRAVIVPNARDLADYSRTNASILAIKEEIRRTRDNVRELPPLQGPLSQMTKDCNGYLEIVERDPNSYAIQVLELRKSLNKQIILLARQQRGIQALEPGGGA